MRFNELNLSKEMLRAIEDCGYTEATYIQKACIPTVLSGGDIIGQSQTGTGKTAAFVIPLLEMLSPSASKRPQALILSPTRELALQVTEEIRKFAKYKEGLRTVCIYGGQPINRQIIDLKKGADIVVGTPGRILDHINRRTLRFNECNTLVLDEADEMLNMGFREDIETVIKALPEERQTILFSATMPSAILDIAKEYQTNPIHIKNPEVQMTSNTIEQNYIECNQSDKRAVLMQLMQINNPNLAMVFCNTKKMVDDLVSELVSKGFWAAGLHGDMKQEMRSLVMDKFKKKKIHILVCTDVAARGIDVDSMDIVFNFDFPQETEYYVHRIGRTGRAGKNGVAYTLITPRQRNRIRDLERLTKSKLIKRELPSNEELKQFHLDQMKSQLLDMLPAKEVKEIKTLLKDITKEGYSYEELACALTHKLIGDDVFKAISKPKESDRVTTKSFKKTKMLLDLGRRQELAAAHVVSAIAEASGIRGSDIGKILIGERETTVEIPSDLAVMIQEAVHKTTIHGFVVKATLLTKDDSRKNERRSNTKDTSTNKKRIKTSNSEKGASRKSNKDSNEQPRSRKSTKDFKEQPRSRKSSKDFKEQPRSRKKK